MTGTPRPADWSSIPGVRKPPQAFEQARRWGPYFDLRQTAPEAQREIMRQRLEAMIGLTETAACRTRTVKPSGLPAR